MNELVKINELSKIDELCELTSTSLKFRRDVTREEFLQVFQAVKQVNEGVQFWIGDLLAYRNQRWGMYDDMIEESVFPKK